MLGRSHMLVGAVAGGLTAQAAGVSPFGIAVCAAVGGISALLPDLDHPGSLLGRHLPKWWHRRTPRHRWVTHSLTWAAGVGFLAATLIRLAGLPHAELVGWVVAVGIVTHLAADAITEQGVPWFWPLLRRRLVLPKWVAIKTGGWAERLLVTVLVAAGVVQLTGGWGALRAVILGSYPYLAGL